MRKLSLLIGIAAAPALAQEAPTPNPASAVAPAVPTAVAVVMQQAQRWLDSGRTDLAAQSIQRALSSEPRNPEVLLLALRVEAARNAREAAAGYASKLKSANPTREQLATADNELRAASLDRSAIDDARRLSRERKSEEAAAAYRAAFGNGEPPALYAREYYQAMAATTAGREAGQRALGQLAAQPGADERTLLADAEQMTYQGESRAKGIDRLAELAKRPSVAADAQRSWKQALGFYGSDTSAIPLYQAYLARYPADADIKQKLDIARTLPPPSAGGPGQELRQRGYSELEQGSLRRSAQHFENALALNGSDASALGGLGIVRLREGRAAEARTLLERAAAADPTQAAQWQRALDAAQYTLELAAARQAIRKGDATGAETVLHRAVSRQVQDSTDAQVLLGEVALRKGDNGAAQQHFRAALQRRPGFGPAASGLNRAMHVGAGENEVTPSPIGSRLTEDARPALDKDVARLRAEAARSSDPKAQSDLLQEALRRAPADPWVRLELARALRRSGRDADARVLMQQAGSAMQGSDADYAGALFAQDTGELSQAEALLARIPAGRRSPNMVRFSGQVRLRAAIARSVTNLRAAPVAARAQLINLAAQPDPSGQAAADAVRALSGAGDKAAASRAAQVAAATNAGSEAKIAIAGALLEAGLDADAAGLVAQAEAMELTPDQQRSLAALRAGSAIRASDRLNEAGRQAAAYDVLRPALATQPNEPATQLALARLHQGAGQPAQAQRVAEAVLARNPRNWDARRGAVEAALASGDRARAETLSEEAARLQPGESRVMLLQAKVARAKGEQGRARDLLQQAAARRAQELGTDSAPGPASMSGDPVNPFETNPGASYGGTGSSDSIVREIGQELRLARQESAPHIAAAALVRVRSGVGGLDSLTEVAAPLEASGPIGNVPGRFVARVTPTLLDSGRLDTTGDGFRRFGTNAIASSAAASKDAGATGVGLSVAYKRGEVFTADIGTSPLGFRITNVLGGVEVAPKLGDTVRLRVRGERRSVTDSLLSFAGARDPATGQVWGGVTQTGGRAQIETKLGPGSAYVLGGYARLDGEKTARNARREAGAGFSFPLMRQGETELTAGLDLVYFAYDNNQRGFTFGQGGYFSPQNFVALNLPIEYRSNIGPLRYTIGATIGYAHFRENASSLFPTSPTMQLLAEAASLKNPLSPVHNVGQTKNGLTGGVRVDLDYPLSDSVSLVGSARFDRAADYQESRVSVRLENRF